MTNETRKRRLRVKQKKRGDNREEDKDEKIWDDRWSWELRMRNEDEENKKNKWQMNRETQIKKEINEKRRDNGEEDNGKRIRDERWRWELKIRNENEDEKNKW